MSDFQCYSKWLSSAITMNYPRSDFWEAVAAASPGKAVQLWEKCQINSMWGLLGLKKQHQPIDILKKTLL